MIKRGKPFRLVKCVICKGYFKKKKKKGLTRNDPNIKGYRAKTCSKKCARKYYDLKQKKRKK
jgi:hypothetical protein